jgi:hypothetical protein
LRRTRTIGITALLAALLWLSPLALPVGSAGADTDPPDPVDVAAALRDRFDARFGGWWVEPADADDGHGDPDRDVTHVAVVEPTAADRRAAGRAAGGGEFVEVHEAEHSHAELVAARDAVARALDPAATGDYAVDVDVRENRLRVETERGDAGVTQVLSLAALQAAATAATQPGPAPAPAPGPLGDTGLGDTGLGDTGLGDTGLGESADRPAIEEVGDVGDVGGDVEDIAVVTGSQIGIDLLGATPTTFPPYEAGLHLLIPSAGSTTRCTSAFAFEGALGTFGSTAGHCGMRGETVQVGETPVAPVSINPFESATEVRADAALYSLSAGGHTVEAVVHGAEHRPVSGSLADSQITEGVQLCFDGRTSGEGNCGAVNAAGRLMCCDAENRSFVFTCIGRPAQSGDSGGPVYQRTGGTVRAAGVLSSSVTVGETRSMCFTTVDAIERETGTAIVTDG